VNGRTDVEYGVRGDARRKRTVPPVASAGADGGRIAGCRPRASVRGRRPPGRGLFFHAVSCSQTYNGIAQKPWLVYM